ncbi:hypothetical protein CISIN_1g033693mg [Citrus sinensis]|uniref:HMA domain-containing protein n=1 Tax=Citrus sinensis TaxID=2711 RepID=A0A067DD96_CITSI|nr:hypothetical protein CISIN_1g033693mg [Citrus sinensis]
MSQTVVLKVGMSCEGCVGAVKRVLGKMDGVETFDIDLKEQKVTVKGNVQPDAVLQTVSKTGKKTAFWERGKTSTSRIRFEAHRSCSCCLRYQWPVHFVGVGLFLMSYSLVNLL